MDDQNHAIRELLARDRQQRLLAEATRDRRVRDYRTAPFRETLALALLRVAAWLAPTLAHSQAPRRAARPRPSGVA